MQRRFPRQKVSVSPLWIRNAVHGFGFHDCDRCRLVIAGGTLTFCAAGFHWTEAGSRPSASPSVVPYSWLCPAECGLSPLSSVACAASNESVSPKRHSFLYTQACGAA